MYHPVLCPPGSYPWPCGSSLYFAYKGKELKPCSEVILLLVHPLPTSSVATTGQEPRLGKHKRADDGVELMATVIDPGDGVELMATVTDPGVPSSDTLIRKRLKLNSETQAAVSQ